MNAKQVLNKIIATLSLQKEEVALTYAKLADGTILESPTFDVGEAAEIVSEDGTKSPAPAGEHELILKDSEGNDVRIKIEVDAEGKITERENVELADGAKEDEVKKLPEDMESIAGEDIGGDEAGDSVDAPVDAIPEDMGKVMEKLQYRIDEMEKKMQKMEESMKPSEETKKEEDIKMEEEELPKLDGAPVDESPVAKSQKENKFGKKIVNTQSTFLSKLYK
jgi:predicted hydrocarbon binding protein